MNHLKSNLAGMTFGQLLRHFRIQRLLTTSELARAASVSKAHISLLEHGTRKPGFTALRRVVTALQLQGEDFNILCEAALRDSPPFMCEREGPDRPDSRSQYSGLREDAGSVMGIEVPPPTAEEKRFLHQAKVCAELQRDAFADVHPCLPDCPMIE